MSTRLRCILLDDELPGLTYLKLLCDQLPTLEVVKAYNSPEKFLSEVKDLNFDLCILDIQMPGVNGLQVANLLRNKLKIFTTAYKEYAADAFDLDAVDYVRKPIQKDRLQQAVDKALIRFSSEKQKIDFIKLNTDKGKALISYSNIGYIKTSDTDSRDKVAILMDGSVVTLKNVSFERLMTELPSSQFCRINKKEIISIKIVFAHSYNEITTSLIDSLGNSVKLSLTEIYKSDFLKLTKGNL
jgi:DNA-binding LytR/AlgR family response regulator